MIPDDATATDRKALRKEIQNAELKYNELIESRNKLNAEARLIAGERNSLNNRKKQLFDNANDIKTQRDQYVSEMRAYKNKRNELQKKAKQLIESQREKKSGIVTKMPLKIEEMKADVQMMEYQQEMSVLSLKEENELIDTIRKTTKEYERLKKEQERQNQIITDLSESERSITELFKQADEAHAKVVEFYKMSQEAHERYIAAINEVPHLINEANKKHKEFLEAKERANAYHQKSLEMLSKIIELKKAHKMDIAAEKKLLSEINKGAREAFAEEKIIKKLDENIDKLFKSGKISL